METTQCPACGRETAAGPVCSECGHVANGSTAVPPEVATWTIERPSPDVLAWARQTFNEAEYLAALREVEQGGGHQFEDFIDEIERIANGHE